jgi:catechol 2,3-dioxygenase-like lactoylglutathione lyase family enzyme
MELARIILRTSDLDRSVAFWSEAFGLAVVAKSGEFAFLDAGKTQLMLNSADDLAEDETLTELVFEVDDIATAYSEMAGRGVVFEVEPRAVMESEGRELHATHFHDPDGHLASITGWVESS